MTSQNELRNLIREACAQLYSASTSGTTTEIMTELTNRFLTLLNHSFSIVSCLNIIHEDEDEKIRYTCAVSLNRCFANLWSCLDAESDSAIEEKKAFLRDFLVKMVTVQQSDRIKHIMVKTLGNRFQQETIDVLCNIAKDVLHDKYGFSICLNLMNECHMLFGYEREVVDFILKYVGTGLNTGQNELILTSLEFGITYFNRWQNECDHPAPEEVGKYWTLSLEILCESIMDPEIVTRIVGILVPSLEENDTYVDGIETYSVLMRLLNNQEIVGLEQSFDIVRLFEAFCSGLGDLLLDPELSKKYVSVASTSDQVVFMNIFNIINRYHIIISTEYSNSYDIELTRVCYFKELSIFLGQNTDILRLFWENMNVYFQSEFGTVTFMTIIHYSMEPGKDFYCDELDNLVEVFNAAIKNDSALVRSVCSSAMFVFCDLFGDELGMYSGTLLENLLDIIQSSPDSIILDVIAIIFKNMESTDEVFDTYVDVLFRLMKSTSDDIKLLIAVFNCLSALIQCAPVKSAENSQHIYQTMISIAMSDTELAFYCRSSAVKCIGHLISSAPSVFQSNAGEVSEFLVKCISADDPALIVDALNSYGHLLNNLDSKTMNTIVPPIELMQTLIRQEKSNLIEEIAQRAAQAIDDDTDDECMVQSDALKYPGLALRLFTSCFHFYPSMIQEHLSFAVESISHFCESLYSTSCEDGLGSIVHVMKGLDIINMIPPEVVMKFIVLTKNALMNTEDKYVAEEAILSVSAILQYAKLDRIPEEGIEHITEMYVELCNQAYPITEGGLSLIQDCVTVFSREIFEAFGRNIPESIDKVIYEVFFPIINPGKPQQSYFVIEILGFYLKSKPLREDIINRLVPIIIALEGKRLQYEGFFFFSVLSEVYPDLFSVHLDVLLNHFAGVLSNKISAKNERSVVAINTLMNCLTNVKNIMGQQFPSELVQLISKYANIK